MRRATFLQRSAAFAGVASFAPLQLRAASAAEDVLRRLSLIDANVDRIMRVTVCTRPFRSAGPRIETERVGDKVVVHNYGHGGSGWSLSWGSAALALEQVARAGETSGEVAVIGCGALGLSAALTAQRAGLKATIYAKERPPFVRSARATGSWTPDSRIALQSAAAPAFGATWERMARTSRTMYESYLGAPGNPVEWVDSFFFSDTRDDDASDASHPPRHVFASYRNRIADITPAYRDFTNPDGTLPFGTKRARQGKSLKFNIADYSRQLMSDFYAAGGTIETRDFHSPGDLATLPQLVIINCTGYGARALWSDESIIPIRGQIAWLIPQESVDFGLYWDGLNVLGRRDGIVVQPSPQGDDTGWNDPDETPDRAAAEAGVTLLRQFLARQG